MIGHLMIAIKEAPTSKKNPELLSAKYRYNTHELRGILKTTRSDEWLVKAGETMEFSITALNDGKAIWIRRGYEVGTIVALGLCTRDEQTLSRLTRLSGLANDVYPGESYQLRIPLRAPKKPGMFKLQIGVARLNNTLFPEFLAEPLVFNIKVQNP